MGNTLETIIYELHHTTDYLIINTITKLDCHEESFLILRRDHERFNELAQKLVVGHSYRFTYSWYDIGSWFPFSNIYQINDLDVYNQMVGTVSRILETGAYFEIHFYNSVYKFLLYKDKVMLLNKTYRIKYLKVYNQNSYVISEFASF